ncbi:MAG: hypothetical protein JSS72_07755 [Armatimonadetes bacterium]|nr:hypothetical protein [Armatimonadota bacterium]
MAHNRKKGGQRKDHKLEKMHKAVAERKANAHEPKPQTDQPDIQDFKPGSRSDDLRNFNPNIGR